MKKKMVKKLTGWDRVQALIRDAEYRKEYDEFSRLTMFKDGIAFVQTEHGLDLGAEYFDKREKLLKRWHLREPVDPKEWRDKKQPKYIAVFSDEPAVKIIPFKTDSDGTEYLENRRYLKLQIDLFEKKGEIKDEVDAIISDFQTIIPQAKRKGRETIKANPWDVYRMHEDGLNFTQIARNLSGLKGNASHEEKLKAWVKAIKRAYNQAERMIKQVGEEAGK
ncbi:MAG: hypothetical protein Kow0025_18370 [Thermodesulfovibrionales bacterium]